MAASTPSMFYIFYFTSLTLCTICNILCVIKIIQLFKNGYKNTMYNVFTLNISIMFIILSIIDSVPKFSDAKMSEPSKLCNIMGSVRMITKATNYTLTFFLFFYSFIILYFQSKKKIITFIFKVIIVLLWVISIVSNFFVVAFGDSKITQLGECAYRTIIQNINIYFIVLEISQIIVIGLLYFTLRKEKNESSDYELLKKLLSLVFYLL